PALAQPAPSNDPRAAARERVRAQRNYDPQAKVAANRMPAAVTVNPEWDRMFRDQFPKFFPGHTLIRQALYSRDWYVKRHEVTNQIEYRQIGTNFGVRAPDGKCFVVALDYYQRYANGRYDSGYFQDGFKREPILCENI
ncbi:hypothetical protein P1X14_12775, partial [Sphingomonas sp. AOB5]|uniref:hypothetical protein n=1 Tax=Sphingomonas sp. AOB5 TaxID=3034017 RepID=UPI0023F63918